MTTDDGYAPVLTTKTRKGRFSAPMAARMCRARKHSARVVLALPGAHRYPFQDGSIADMARRAARVGGFLSGTPLLDSWIYTSTAHRVPPLDVRSPQRWIGDWAALPKESLLPRDGEPRNLLLRNADEFSLFGPEDAAAAINEISRGVSDDGEPTLVLFFVYALRSEGTHLASALDGAAGKNVFWQFFGDTSDGGSALSHLDALRAEAPHIRNVGLYNGWDRIQETPEYLFYRGVLGPFARWQARRSPSTA
ncbi:VWA domain-containing protein [Streptomyces sp. NPDC012600]|uniref:VWA domain-containing protein n=1 Tax=Streptomyces sp. NPDC012600 TaxID=3415005 RepID=UPI003C2BF6A5